MNKFLVLALLCTNAFAAPPWSELAIEKSYRLGQTLAAAPGHGLPADEHFILQEAQPLEGINVSYYRFSWEACQWPELVSEMELALPLGAPANSEVGFVLNHCNLEIYVENKDLETSSLFH